MVRKPVIQYGFFIGLLMLLLQGMLLRVMMLPILVIVYILILIIPILFSRPKISLAILMGYIISLAIFLILVYAAYHIMIFFTKI